MTIAPNSYRQRLLLAAASSLAALTVAGANAYAQSATSGGATEQVVVTGSRLKRSDATSDTPVTVVSATDIKRTGAQTIQDILQRIPAIGTGGIYATSNNGGVGAACTDIRQLGYQRTLILVNGKRFTQTAGDVFSCVDLNTIPVNMIERIEVVKDGASSVYGADAVAGVINIITRKNFSGTTVNVDGSMAGEGDAKTGKISFTSGANFDRGNIVVSGGYETTSPIEQKDRDWSHFVYIDNSNGYRKQTSVESFPGVLEPLPTLKQGGRIGSSIGVDGRVFAEGNPVFDDNGDPVRDSSGNVVYTGNFTTPKYTGVFYDTDGNPLINGFKPSAAGVSSFSSRANRFNWGDWTYLREALERYNLSTSLNYEINDNINFYSQAYYTHVKTEQQLAPNPVTGGSPSSTIFQDVVIPGFYSDYKTANPLVTAILGSGNEQDMAFWKRFYDLGARHYTQTNDTFDIVAGFNGSLAYGWDYDLYFNYGHSAKQQVESNITSYTRLEQLFGFKHTYDLQPYVDRGFLTDITKGSAINAGYFDPTLCQASDGCDLITANNLTANGLFLTKRQQDYIRVNNTANTTYTLKQWGGTLTNNDLYDLPYGPLGVVVGAEHRSEAATYAPDSEVATNTTTNPALYATNGQFDVTEVFGEVNVPILKDLPFAKRLDVRLSGRWSDYSTFGSAETWGVAANYAPVQDIRFRASLGTSFRQPNVFEAYGGGTTSYESASDPCSNAAAIGGNVLANCTAQGAVGVVNQNGQVPTLKFKGNPDLNPETARTWTIGTVITPRWIPGFSFTADYYHTRLRNTIGALDTPTLLNECYSSPNLSSPYCALISPRNSTGQLTLVNSPSLNLGETRTDGLDLGAAWTLPLGNGMGTLTFKDDFTFLFSYLSQNAPGGDFIQYAGQQQTGNPFQAWPRRRNNFTIDYGRDALHVGYTMRYISGMSSDYSDFQNGLYHLDNSGNVVFDRLSGSTAEVFYHDIYASYSWKNIDGIIGVDNLLDKNPPFVADGQTNTNVNQYDVIGRLFYLRTSIHF